MVAGHEFRAIAEVILKRAQQADVNVGSLVLRRSQKGLRRVFVLGGKELASPHREIEFLCGLKDEKMLRHHDLTDEARAILERRLREESLRDVFFAALTSLGKLSSFSAGATETEKFDARSRAIHALYLDERNHRDWLDVCERLTEFDELVVSWRLRHIQMVERTIGARMSRRNRRRQNGHKVAAVPAELFPQGDL